MPPKITIVGAGSAVFSLGLVRDLCLTPGLGGSTVCLMDIDQGRLGAIHALCRRYAEEVGADLHLEQTTDRQEALAGTDFVVVTALAAGHDRLRTGWAVAEGHGYRFGGSLHVMHDEAFWINFYQLKLFESLVEDILGTCPDAWCLLVANPVLAGVTHLAAKYPRAKVVGLCHGCGAVNRLADLLGLPRDEITYELPGVNHHLWLTHFSHNGRDAFPLLDAWIERDAAAYAATARPSDLHGPKPVDLYRRFGAFPIGDTANPGGGSWGWWYHTDAETEHRWHEDPKGWYDRHFVRGEKQIAEIKRIAEDGGAKVTEAYPPESSGESMVPLIEAIACDLPRTYVVNVINDGEYVAGIPRDFSVEIPALVSARGIQGIRTNGLPAPLLAQITRDRVAPVRMELAAYTGGSREGLLQLLLMDPWTRSEAQANGLLDAILALPEHGEMRAHYR
jgi:alpha-galactosidase